MATVLPSPPGLEGHAWRPLRREDAPALHHLELECCPVDGSTSLSSVEGYLRRFDQSAEHVETDTLCAVSSAGRLAATAWVTCDDSLQHECRVFLDGRVHPKYRGQGLGSFLLQWMEARAHQMLSELKEDKPGVLRFDFYDRSDDALALFEQHGFRLAFAEDEMRRDLSRPLPEAHLPAGMTLVTWSPQRAGRFFETYRDAFRERPRFPNWSEETWRIMFASGASFRDDLSLLLLEGTEPVGFVLCHVEDDAEMPGGLGWIAQMGLRPAWRNRGLGAFLLCEVLRRLRADGLAWAALEVNVDNDRALRLYQRLGFELYRRRTSYQKVADTG
jgi:mycothiol synthase